MLPYINYKGTFAANYTAYQIMLTTPLKAFFNNYICIVLKFSQLNRNIIYIKNMNITMLTRNTLRTFLCDTTHKW